MAKDIEELKMILDMAANGGKMQAQNEMLLDKIAQLENEIKRQKNEIKKLRNDLAEKAKECEEKDHRIEELEAKLMCVNTEGTVQFVYSITGKYYVLGVGTVSSASLLND